jgi:nuclear pore complex protein Nup107
MPGLLIPDMWPPQVIYKQPRDLNALFHKLHSGDLVHEAVCRGCKEQHRQIQIALMLGDLAHLLDLLWAWIAPPNDNNVSRPHGHPQMIRFGAHLVLVLLALLMTIYKKMLRIRFRLFLI